MAYSPVSVLNGILEFGFRDGVAVDPMKAQKLTFFSHGYYIAATGEPLLNEYFQAWKLGPVVPSLYHSLKKYRSGRISEYGIVWGPDGNLVPAAPPENDSIYTEVREFVWSTYGRWDSMALSNLTHARDGAWDRTLRDSPNVLGPQINNQLIIDEFKPLVTPA